MNTLRLAVVTDIHNGPDRETQRGSQVPRILKALANDIRRYKPDMLIDLGDRVNDVDRASDLKHLSELAEIIADIGVPCTYLMGNHDLDNLSIDDNERVLRQSMSSSSLEIKGVHLVFWRPDAYLSVGRGLDFRRSDLNWLSDELKSTRLPTVVFSHIPVHGGSMTSNYFFEELPDLATYRASHEIRQLLREVGNVILWVAGHLHWNSAVVVDGIAHVSIASLADTWTKPPEPAGAWAAIEVGQDIHVTVQGRDPYETRLPIHEAGDRWVPRVRAARPVRRVDGAFLGGIGAIIVEAPASSEHHIDIMRDTADQRGVKMLATAPPKADVLIAPRIGRLPSMEVLSPSQIVALHVAAIAPGAAVWPTNEELRIGALACGLTIHSDPDYVLVGESSERPWKATTDRSPQYVATSSIAKAQCIARSADANTLSPSDFVVVSPETARYFSLACRKLGVPSERVLFMATRAATARAAVYAGLGVALEDPAKFPELGLPSIKEVAALFSGRPLPRAGV